MSGTPIVLGYGAWDGGCPGGWAWERLVPQLRKAGRDVVAVELPSTGRDPSTLGDLAADAAVVSSALDGVAGPAVLVGHSYGGQVFSQASAGRDDVAHLADVCAQDAMSAHAGTVVRLSSAHSPFLSMPDRIAEILLGA